MSNGSSLPPGPGLPPQPLPGWLGSGVQIITQVGVPTVFAAVLLYFVLFKVGHTLEAIEDGEENRTRIMAAMQDTLIAALNRQGDRFEKAIHENMEINKEMGRNLREYIDRLADYRERDHERKDKER